MRLFALSFMGLAFWVFPMSVFATGYFFQPLSSDVGIGDTFDVVVGLTTDGESVNALEGILTYDPAVLELVQVNTSRSAVNLWIEDPAVISSATDGRIVFSGVTPGGIGQVLIPPTDGYPATTVFVPRFTALAAGDVRISIDAPGMYRNDGEGTEIATSSTSLVLAITPDSRGVSVSDSTDTRAPLEFTVSISQSVNAFEGKRFASFIATDKESGISYYEVSENGGSFVRASSPYVLQDQDGNVVLRVRAFDRSGNVQDAVARIGVSVLMIIGWCILALFALCILIAVFYRGVWRSRGVRR